MLHANTAQVDSGQIKNWSSHTNHTQQPLSEALTKLAKMVWNNIYI
jgi:hypothetical protein